MTKYPRNFTVPIKMEVRYQGTLVDVTSPKCTVYDPTGTAVVADVGMTKQSTGVYLYQYTITSSAMPGVYKAIVYADFGVPEYAAALKFRVTEEQL